MLGRRDQHHHAAALTRTVAWLVALAIVPALATSPLSAGTLKVAPDGSVHTVRAETWQSMDAGSNDQPPSAGTSLRYTRQAPDGTKRNQVIPGTDDRAEDRQPAVALRAGTSDPIVIWTRDEGLGFELFVSAFVDGEWSPMRRVFPGSRDRHNPELQVRGHWLHVTWEEKTPEGTAFLRGVLDPADLGEVHGPETLPTDQDEGLVPASGEPDVGTSPEPDPTSLQMSGLVAPTGPGDGGKIVVWGVRDEPIPITYLQGFLLPTGLNDVTRVRSQWLAGRPTVSFQDGQNLFYTMRLEGRWTDLRSIALSERSSEEALLEVKAMIEREAAAEQRP